MATLAVALGAVWLMRRGAWLVVDRFGLGGQADYADALPDRRPPEKVYDLAKLVPEMLEFNIAGLELHAIGTTLDRPYDLAIKMDEQLAAAQGWELLDVPLAYEFAQLARGEHLYRTPTGDIKRRTYYEIAGHRTRREELTIPAASCPRLTGDESFEAVVGIRAEALRAALPEVLREVVVGEVFQTRVLRRGSGTALHLTVFDRFDDQMARTRVAAAFVGAGWTVERRGELVFRRTNLMAFANVLPRDAGEGVLVLYRFSDDEALEDVPVDGEDKKDVNLTGGKRE